MKGDMTHLRTVGQYGQSDGSVYAGMVTAEARCRNVSAVLQRLRY